MGMYADPLSLFGRLSMEMMRAVRLVVDTGIHSKGWNVQQAIFYMMEKTGMHRHECKRSAIATRRGLGRPVPTKWVRSPSGKCVVRRRRRSATSLTSNRSTQYFCAPDPCLLTRWQSKLTNGWPKATLVDTSEQGSCDERPGRTVGCLIGLGGHVSRFW